MMAMLERKEQLKRMWWTCERRHKKGYQGEEKRIE